MALAKLGADAKHAMAFEDSAAGITSARDAGMKVVAITLTNHYGHDTTHAHEHIRDLTGVTPSWIRDFSTRLTSSGL